MSSRQPGPNAKGTCSRTCPTAHRACGVLHAEEGVHTTDARGQAPIVAMDCCFVVAAGTLVLCPRCSHRRIIGVHNFEQGGRSRVGPRTLTKSGSGRSGHGWAASLAPMRHMSALPKVSSERGRLNGQENRTGGRGRRACHEGHHAMAESRARRGRGPHKECGRPHASRGTTTTTVGCSADRAKDSRSGAATSHNVGTRRAAMGAPHCA